MLKLFRWIVMICLIFTFGLVALGVTSAQESERQVITVDNVSQVGKLANFDVGDQDVNVVTISPDGMLLASGGSDGVVRIWNLESGGNPMLFEGHTGPVYSLAFSPDGSILASGGDTSNQVLLAWNIESGEVIGQIEVEEDMAPFFEWGNDGEPVKMHLVVFSPNGEFVFVAGEILTHFFWYPETGNTVAGSTEWSSGDPDIMSMSFSEDESLAAMGRSDGLLLTTIDETGAVQSDENVTLPCHSDVVSSVQFDSSGTKLASGSWDDTVCLWNIDHENSEYEAAVLEGHLDDVTGVAFSPDGTVLVSSSLDGTLRLWNVETQEQLDELIGSEAGAVRSVAFSSNGTMIASAHSDGYVWLWGIGDNAQESFSESPEVDTSESVELSITLDTGTVELNIVGIVFGDRWPTECDVSAGFTDPNSCFGQANPGYKMLFVVFDSDDMPEIPDEVYVTAGDDNQYPIALSGNDPSLLPDGGSSFIAFVVPSSSETFTLFWPGNSPIELVE